MALNEETLVSDLITLSEAALLLRIRYQRALNLLLLGELDGERTESGRWVVRRTSCERWAAGRARTSTSPAA